MSRELVSTVEMPHGTNLDLMVAELVAQGAEVVSTTSSGVVLRFGRNKWWPIHLLLTLLTGVWLFVWIIIATAHRSKRCMITLTLGPDGRITKTVSKW